MTLAEWWLMYDAHIERQGGQDKQQGGLREQDKARLYDKLKRARGEL